MASISVEGFDDVIRKLEKLSKKDEVEGIAKKAIDAAKGVVVSSMKSAVASSEHGPYSTGSVSGSISPTDIKVNSYGVYSVARPTGRDRKATRNGAKAAFLEYGTPRMAARPWRARAVASAEGKAIKIIEEVLQSEMELE